MAGVTSEILSNMLRSSLTDLKSFVEILNAELTEEGQGIILYFRVNFLRLRIPWDEEYRTIIMKFLTERI